MKVEDLPPLEDKCTTCNGAGTIGKKVKSRCTMCGGKGKQLSQFGMMLLDFMQEYRPWEEDVSDLRREIERS